MMLLATTGHAGAVIGGSLILAILMAGIVGWGLLLSLFYRSGFPSLSAGRLQGQHWSGLDILVTGAWVVGLLIPFHVLGWWLKRIGIDLHWLHVVAALQNTILQLLVVAVLFVRMRTTGSNLYTGFGVPSAGQFTWRRVWGDAVRWYVLCLPLVFVGGLISQFLFSPGDGEPLFQPVLEIFRDAATPGWFRWWLVGVAVIGAPVVEEAFFRGMLLPVLARKHAVWPALIACSLLFALVHGHGPALLPLFILGLGLGGAYLYTGNLLVPICMHALFNTITLFVQILIALGPPVV
jgi:membrane protease YdiL (CAAX protease family)